jgi:hypothetical protein
MAKVKVPLEKRISAAQAIGNVSSSEYMVPYPNLASLVEGQTIKYGDKQVYPEYGLTNHEVHRLVQQTANWLKAKNLRPGQRVLFKPLPFPDSVFLAFGIWSLGGTIVLTGDEDYSTATSLTSPVMTVSDSIHFREKITHQQESFSPAYNPSLNDEALIFCQEGVGIRLSHYNLLVNTNGVMHALNLDHDQSFFAELPPVSTAWVVLQLLLPFYSGAVFNREKPDVYIALLHSKAQPDIIVDFHWTELEESDPPRLYVKPENTAFLALNRAPLHLTAIRGENRPHHIQGHSVMMGYLDDRLNDRVFQEGWLKI